MVNKADDGFLSPGGIKEAKGMLANEREHRMPKWMLRRALASIEHQQSIIQQAKDLFGKVVPVSDTELLDLIKEVRAEGLVRYQQARRAAQRLIEEIGAPGPESLEETADRAVQALRRAKQPGPCESCQTLKAQVREAERGRKQAEQTLTNERHAERVYDGALEALSQAAYGQASPPYGQPNTLHGMAKVIAERNAKTDQMLANDLIESEAKYAALLAKTREFVPNWPEWNAISNRVEQLEAAIKGFFRNMGVEWDEAPEGQDEWYSQPEMVDGYDATGNQKKRFSELRDALTADPEAEKKPNQPCEKCGAEDGTFIERGFHRCNKCGYPGQ